MITAVLRGARHMGSQLAAMLPRKGGGGCGIYFDAAGMQFVRMTCVARSPRVRLDACGSAMLDDGMLSGSVIAKPEAVARRLEEMLERSDMSVRDLQDDTVVLALPSHELQTQVVDYPTDLPPRAVQAWCERRAALLLPGDGGPDLRSRVGVTWADPGSHRLRLYACEAALVDDRIAVLEMAGLRVHAIDASHKAGRRAFLVARPPEHAPSPIAPTSEVGPPGMPLALLQVDAHAIDLAIFDGNVCVADIRERFDGIGGHPEALASVVRELTRKLPVAPLAVHLVAQAASPGELSAICDAVATMCGIDVHPYDPLPADTIDVFRTPLTRRAAQDAVTMAESTSQPSIDEATPVGSMRAGGRRRLRGGHAPCPDAGAGRKRRHSGHRRDLSGGAAQPSRTFAVAGRRSGTRCPFPQPLR